MGRRADNAKRVGEVARATGLTVRTLHYYDEIGLLVPSERSDVGHRLYSAGDLERLYRITRLRKIGMTLEDIGHALDDDDWNLESALNGHVDQLDRQLAVGHRLRQGLAAIVRTLSTEESRPHVAGNPVQRRRRRPSPTGRRSRALSSPPEHPGIPDTSRLSPPVRQDGCPGVGDGASRRGHGRHRRTVRRAIGMAFPLIVHLVTSQPVGGSAQSSGRSTGSAADP